MHTSILKDVSRNYIKDKDILKFAEFLFDRFGIDSNLELNILFSDDKKIRELNMKFRQKDEATDILSFYGYDGDVLGDIIISVETMEKEAEEKNKEISFYTLFLLSHGFLHLIGNTHETLEKYNDMINIQNNLMEEWKNETKN